MGKRKGGAANTGNRKRARNVKDSGNQKNQNAAQGRGQKRSSHSPSSVPHSEKRAKVHIKSNTSSTNARNNRGKKNEGASWLNLNQNSGQKKKKKNYNNNKNGTPWEALPQRQQGRRRRRGPTAIPVTVNVGSAPPGLHSCLKNGSAAAASKKPDSASLAEALMDFYAVVAPQ